MSGIRKLVLISLADQCNDEGLCWPSIASIVRRTGCGERTVQRAISWLEESQVINRVFRGGHSTHYLITPAKFRPPSERHPVRATPRHSGVTTPSERHPTPATVAPPPPSERHPESSVEPSKKRKRNVKTGLPPDFGISNRVESWAKAKGYGRLDEHLENFVGLARAKGYEYLDWDEAFMNAIRGNWAKLERTAPEPDYSNLKD